MGKENHQVTVAQIANILNWFYDCDTYVVKILDAAQFQRSLLPSSPLSYSFSANYEA